MQKKAFGVSGCNNTSVHQLTTKTCHGQKILTNRQHWFIRIFIYSKPSEPIFFHMDKNGNRHISEGEKKYGNPDYHLWGKAVATWKKEVADLTKTEAEQAVRIANAMMKDPYVGYPSHLKSEFTRKNKIGPVLSQDRKAEPAKLGNIPGFQNLEAIVGNDEAKSVNKKPVQKNKPQVNQQPKEELPKVEQPNNSKEVTRKEKPKYGNCRIDKFNERLTFKKAVAS